MYNIRHKKICIFIKQKYKKTIYIFKKVPKSIFNLEIIFEIYNSNYNSIGIVETPPIIIDIFLIIQIKIVITIGLWLKLIFLNYFVFQIIIIYIK